MSKRGIKLYVEDITNSLKKIEEYTKNLTFDQFNIDTKTVDAVIRNLTVIGEAAKNIPDEIKIKYDDIPWEEIIGMRNKVIHEYFGVDENILWETVKEDLPVFEKQILEIEL